MRARSTTSSSDPAGESVSRRPRARSAVAQRVDRIHAARPPRRDERRDDSHGEEERRHARERDRIGGAYAHEEGAHDAAQDDRAREAEPDTGERHGQSLSENQPHDIALARPEGDTHANLTRPLLRRIRDHAVEAERRQAQRHDGERADERQQEPRLRHRARDVRRER